MPSHRTHYLLPDPDVIAAARPLREDHRPAECDARAGCWVQVGPAGCSTVEFPSNNKAPRCCACGGKIK